MTNFTIQWSASPDTSTWYDVADHVAGSANGHVVRGLQPYSNIVFRVIAENRYGKSVPSDSTSEQECKTAEASKFTEFSHQIMRFQDLSPASEQSFTIFWILIQNTSMRTLRSIFSLCRAYNLSRRRTRIS